MLSANAQKGLDEIFRKAVKLSAAIKPGTSCHVEAANDFGGSHGNKFVVFTISAPSFKCLMFFHINGDKAFLEFFSGTPASATDGAGQRAFLDTFFEFGNICCGAMNRDLLSHYPNLGMSTPYVLQGKSLEFMPFLRPGHVRNFSIRINADVEFMVTLCMCNYQDLDFEMDTEAAEEESGTLELL